MSESRHERGALNWKAPGLKDQCNRVLLKKIPKQSVFVVAAKSPCSRQDRDKRTSELATMSRMASPVAAERPPNEDSSTDTYSSNTACWHKTE